MDVFSILIVDDDKCILNSLKRLFVDEKYVLYTAQSGEEGLEILAREKIDLIISDQKMPVMNGLEFLEKTVEKYPDVIRIILTGYAELSDAIRAVNSGCIYKFIQKPWNNDDLKITVRRALEQYDLIMKNRDLTMELKKMDKILDDLEKEYPGITKRPEDGIFKIKSEE
jgi:DNA-binding NtrC family response regulator